MDNALLYSKDGTTIISCDKSYSGEITVLEGINNIEDNAFENCSLSKIVVPSSLKRIGRRAFSKVATGTGDWVYFDVPTTCPNDYYDSNYKGTTSLKRIESYRLRELIMEDLRIYQPCSITDIHERIGKEIPLRKLQFQIKQLIAEGKLDSEGQKRWTKYRIKT